MSTDVKDRRAARRRRRRTEEPTWELVYKRNSIERLKREKFPLDIVEDLPAMIEMGYEAVPEEDIVRLNWWGLTHDKPKIGTFMVRIKVAGGLLDPAQLRGVGKISKEWGNNYGELTTRQGLQLHYVSLDELPAVLEAVESTGLTTCGGEGDTVRNITGCPVAGIAEEELFDVRPVIREVADYFYGNRDYSNLPRKHKFTIATCPGQCNGPEFHDIALVGAVKDGREGFTVRVGGGLSNTPRLSKDLGVFIPTNEAVEVLAVITDAWQEDPKYRISRAKARIKFMMDDHGPDGVRKMAEERLGRELEDFEAPEPQAYNHFGVHRQKQEGLVYAGVSVPMGWMTGDQMIGVADLVEDLGADLRLTRQQSFIVGNLPEDRLEDLDAGLTELGFPLAKNEVYGKSIACTSHKFCNYSVAETKGKLDEILEDLEGEFGDDIADLEIYMDGCPHSCAHHWIGDIGLQGTTTKLPDTNKRVEAYDVTLRGGTGHQAAIGTPLLRRVPTGEINDTVVRLVGAWLTEKASRNGHGAGYSFKQFCDERSDEELVAIGGGELAAAAAAAADRDLPFWRVPGTLLELSDGADEVPVEAGTVGEALEALREQHPTLVGEILHDDGSVNPIYNLYVGEDDIRALGGFDAELEPGDALTILPALAGGC